MGPHKTKGMRWRRLFWGYRSGPCCYAWKLVVGTEFTCRPRRGDPSAPDLQRCTFISAPSELAGTAAHIARRGRVCII